MRREYNCATTYTVEGRGINGRVNLVCTGDGVRREERNDLEGSEAAGILETVQDGGNVVRGQGNETLDGGGGPVLAASKELELGRTL